MIDLSLPSLDLRVRRHNKCALLLESRLCTLGRRTLELELGLRLFMHRTLLLELILGHRQRIAFLLEGSSEPLSRPGLLLGLGKLGLHLLEHLALPL